VESSGILRCSVFILRVLFSLLFLPRDAIGEQYMLHGLVSVRPIVLPSHAGIVSKRMNGSTS